jgi:cytochrome c-type biogenesis protein CcmF
MLAGVIGKGLVWLAISAYLVSVAGWLAGRARLGSAAFVVGTGLVVATFAVHVGILLTQQYEYAYTFHNTERDMPTIYRLSAAWASQEGSFLLWTLMSSMVAAIAARRTDKYRRWYTVICGVAVSAMLSVVAYESPFKLLELSADDRQLLAPGQVMVMPPDGGGLNPTLMNYWMVIHPWVIFIGFGSLLALFAWSVSAAVSRDWSGWVSRIRPLAIFSMTVLGVGLTMGGLWAYETLGWGGFWAWDPVENVSLVPFIATTVFTHGLYVQGGRGRWARGNLLFGALPFLWFVYGTYLTRSGALVQVSVHSFAEMNAGAHGLLLGLVIATALAVLCLAVWVFTHKSPQGDGKPLGNRQAGLGIGMALLYGIGIMAAVGMSIPFLASLGLRISAFGAKDVVKEETYNQIVAYPFVPALLLMAIVPFLGWTATRPQRWRMLSNLFFAAVLLFGVMAFLMVRNGMTLVDGAKMPGTQLAVLFTLVFVCIFSIVANGARLIERLRAGAGGVGSFLMHSGVSTLLLGLIVSHAFQKTQTAMVTTTVPGSLRLLPNHSYLAMLDGLPSAEALSNKGNTLSFRLVTPSGKAERISPNYYFTQRDNNLVSRPFIINTLLYDLYFVVGSPELSLAPDVELLPGETKKTGEFTVEYVKKTQVGEPGMKGTRFGAKLIISYDDRDFVVNPEIVLDSGGAQRKPAQLEDVGMAVLQRLDAKTSAAKVAILAPEPMFPVQLFYKPLVLLVWLGAGMMTLGGLFAFGKRRSRAHFTNSDAPAEPPQIEDSPRKG